MKLSDLANPKIMAAVRRKFMAQEARRRRAEERKAEALSREIERRPLTSPRFTSR